MCEARGATQCRWKAHTMRMNLILKKKNDEDELVHLKLAGSKIENGR
jgi:hypothetical protein